MIEVEDEELREIVEAEAPVRTYGSLFTGIGGLDLAVEAVFPEAECVWQCEADPWRREILERHWGPVAYDDVREMERHDPECMLDDDCMCGHGVQRVDLICGGFPCQDVATNGRRAGIEGKRSGLWVEFARLLGVLRPRFAFVENVAGLTARGFGRVLGDLADLGFDAEWVRVRACDAGALHRRTRLFILAHSNQIGSGGSMGSRRDVESWGRSVRSDLSRRGLAHGSKAWAQIVGYEAPEPRVCDVADGLQKKLALRSLEALGDAVVPQQGALALRIMMDQFMSIDNIIEPLRSQAIDISTINLDPRNARKHDKRNIEAIKLSLQRFGQRIPIVVQTEGMIVRAGNGRVMAMREMGWTKVAVTMVSEADTEATAFGLADNRTAELGEWDAAVLGSLLAELSTEGAVDSALWNDEELKQFEQQTNAMLSGDPPVTAPADVSAPPEFKAYDENIAVEHGCPKCGYTWSGSSKPAEGEG